MVRVKHLVEFLSRFHPEMEILLDKDGWMQDELSFKDEVDLIKKRGIFQVFADSTTTYLVINN